MQIKLKTTAEILAETGLSCPTIIKYEHLGIIPAKKSATGEKIYFPEAVERLNLLKFLVRNMYLPTTAILVIFGLVDRYKIPLDLVFVICNSIMPEEKQQNNIKNVKKRGSRN